MSAPTKRKTKGKTTTAITISEFKQWLSGVEDMQEGNWVPDAAQWAKIRAKIDLVEEEQLDAVATVSNALPAAQPYQSYVPAPSGYNALVDVSMQYQPVPRQQSMLDGDSITMPSKTIEDIQMDQQYANNTFQQYD